MVPHECGALNMGPDFTENEIWREGAGTFMALEHLSQDRALHPALLRLIHGHPGTELLDYGCGDGRIIPRLDARWNVDAYDPSEPMRALARARVGSRIRTLSSTTEGLKGPYDSIILGMVIMCIPERSEVRRVLADCARLLAPEGQVFITTTHPCFRNQTFSNFRTSFTGHQPFHYGEDGTPFQVTIWDPDGKEVSFTDYHWSLDFTLAAVNDAGMSVTLFHEVYDDPSSADRNSLVPPYLILRCGRRP